MKKLKKKKLSIPQLKKRIQGKFNLWIRQHKSETVCIACGEEKQNMVAGHFFGVHKYNWMRFVEDNCWLECSSCNSFNHESLIGYTLNLQKKLGSERFNKLLEESKVRKPEFTREELETLTQKYGN